MISWIVPTLLSFVAGYVDSCIFLALHGLFVAQVTGSFVVAGAQFAAHDNSFLIKVLAIPVFFASGLLTAGIVAVTGEPSRWALATTLALVATLLTGLLSIGLFATFDNPEAPATLAAALLGLSAMGVQSALVRLLLQGYGSTNVMTTNTTQLAIDVTQTAHAWCNCKRDPTDASAIRRYAQGIDRLSRLLPILLGFLAGTATGGMAYLAVGLICLLLAIGILAALAVGAAWRPQGLAVGVAS